MFVVEIEVFSFILGIIVGIGVYHLILKDKMGKKKKAE